jgi:hypothetical protein
MGLGIIFVHRFLNPWRAIKECWRANIVIKPVSAISEGKSAPVVPESIVFGTAKLPRKQIVYIKTPRNNT